LLYGLLGDTIGAAVVLLLVILAVAACVRDPVEGRSKVHWIFVISAPHQRCYSEHPARGIQWPGGPTCND